MTHSPRRALVAFAAVLTLVLAACTTSDSAVDREVVTSLEVNEPAATAIPAAPQQRVYVVQPEDTLVSIAAAEGITLAELLELNEVANPSVIEPGLELVLPPDPLAAPEPVVRVVTPAPVVEPPPVEETWYQALDNRLPTLPEGLEPARPVILAVGIITVTVLGVGVLALGFPLLFSVLSAAAAGLAFGGGRLQAALAGVPADPEAVETERRSRWRRPQMPSLSWPQRLRFSRSTVALPRRSVSLPVPGRSLTSVAAPTPQPAPARGTAQPRAVARAGAAIRRRTNRMASTVSTSVGRAGHATVAGARTVGRSTLAMLAVAGHALLRLARAVAVAVVYLARRAAAAPMRRLEEFRETRRRRQFREQVESTTAARLRLGLRQDTEAFLQKSVDESLREGWRLEAAWCLQLMAEEAGRRDNHALAELRQVRARELIREHALAEDPGE